MTDYDTFPDAEAFAAWALRDAGLEVSERVYSSIPRQPTFPLIIVTRIGGVPVERHRLDSPSIQVSVWAENKSTAHDVAQEARSVLHGCEGGIFGTMDDCPVSIVITSVEDNLGMSFLPDPETHRDRYIFGVRLVTHVGPSIS